MQGHVLAVLLAAIAAAGACGGRSATPAPTAAPAPEHAPHGGHDHGGHAGHAHAGHQPAGDAAAHAHGSHAVDDAHHSHAVDDAHHAFTDAERWAKVFDDPARDAWQRPDEVVALLAIAPGMTVADLGAGTGYFIGRLDAAVGARGRVLALDVEAEMVTYLQERGRRDGWKRVHAQRVAPDDPQLVEASVDRVLVVDTWHHLGDRGSYVKKLAGALRAGGRVVVVDFTLDAPVGPPPAARLSAETVAAELASAGLETSIAQESLPHQYVVIGSRPRR